MDEKELLKQAFEYGNVPSIITYCWENSNSCQNNRNTSNNYSHTTDIMMLNSNTSLMKLTSPKANVAN